MPRKVRVVERVEVRGGYRVIGTVPRSDVWSAPDRGPRPVLLVTEADARHGHIADPPPENCRGRMRRGRDPVGASKAGGEDVVVGLRGFQDSVDEPGAARAERLEDARLQPAHLAELELHAP